MITELSISYLSTQKNIIAPQIPFNARPTVGENTANYSAANTFYANSLQNTSFTHVTTRILEASTKNNIKTSTRVKINLSDNFIIKFTDKTLSKKSKSLKAEQNRIFLTQNAPLIERGSSFRATTPHITAEGETVQVDEPIKILNVLDDLSLGRDRVLIPMLNKPADSAFFHHRTQNCALRGTNSVFERLNNLLKLPDYELGAAVGYISTTEEDYLIIVRDINELNKIRNTQEVPMHQVTWFITKNVINLIERIVLLTKENYPEIKCHKDGYSGLQNIPINISASQLLDDIDYSHDKCQIM